MTASDRHIEPTGAQLQELIDAAAHDDGPVVMVNLLAFNDDGGRESYLRYAADVQPHLERVGATLLYAGNAAHTVIGGADTSWWDAILLVQYPSRTKFLEMVSDADYQAIGVHRTAALATSGLVATTLWLS